MRKIDFNEYAYSDPWIEVDSRTLNRIIEGRKPLGRFYCEEEDDFGEKVWVAVDNTHGEAFTEMFYSEDDAQDWLSDEDADAENYYSSQLGEANEVAVRDNTQITNYDTDVTAQIINKLASIAQALASAYDWDPRLVMNDMINDLHIINGERLTDIVDEDNPWSQMTKQLADEARDMGLDSNIALNSLLQMDERECINLMNNIIGRNRRLDMRNNNTRQLPRYDRRMIEDMNKMLVEDRATREAFVNKFGQEAFDDFNRLKDRLRNKGITVDLSWHVAHTTPEDMKEILYNAENRIDSRSEEEQRVKVAENDNYEVWDIRNYKTAMKYGNDTCWCITGRYSDGHVNQETNLHPKESQAAQYFPDYLESTYDMYLFAFPKKEGLKKYCICPRRGSEDTVVWDKADHSFNIGPDGARDSEGTQLLKNLPKIDYRGFSTEVKEWVIRSGELIKYNGEDADLVIPAEVTSIRDRAFAGNTSIVSISLPAIEEIPANLCEGCTGLKRVKISDGTKYIRERAFFGCSNLERVDLPESVAGEQGHKGIGINAFQGCDNVSIITPKHVIFFPRLDTEWYKAHLIWKVNSLDSFARPYEGQRIALGSKVYTYNGTEFEETGSLAESLQKKSLSNTRDSFALSEGKFLDKIKAKANDILFDEEEVEEVDISEYEDEIIDICKGADNEDDAYDKTLDLLMDKDDEVLNELSQTADGREMINDAIDKIIAKGMKAKKRGIREAYAKVDGKEGYWVVRDNNNPEFVRTSYYPEAEEVQKDHKGSWIDFVEVDAEHPER